MTHPRFITIILLMAFFLHGKSQCLSGAFDADNDGIYDFFDIDNDNDGLLNQTECLFVPVDWSSIITMTLGSAPQTVFNDVNGDILPSSCTVGNLALTPPTQPLTSGTLHQKNGNQLNFSQFKYNRGGGLRASVTFDDYSLIKINALALSSDITNEDTILLKGIGAPADFRWVLWEHSNATYIATGNCIKIAGNHPILHAGFLVIGTEAIIGVDIYHINSKTNTSQGTNEASVGFSYLLDTDGDRVPDLLDLDSDNDGLPDAVEATGNFTTSLENCSLDDDGNANYPDNNNDNCPDGLVNGFAVQFPLDSDNDGIPDYRERDADADNCLDSEETLSWVPPTVNIWKDSTTVDTRGRILNGPIGFCLSPTTDAWKQNCVGVCFEPEKDYDGDHIADFSDVDQDNDGILDQYETICPFLQTTANSSGIGNFKKYAYILTWDGPIFNDGIQNGESASFSLQNGMTIHVIFTYSGTSDWSVTDLGANPIMGSYYNAPSTKDAITNDKTGNHALNIQITATLDGIAYPVELLVFPTKINGAFQESIVVNNPTLFPVEIIESGGIYEIPTILNPPFSLKVKDTGNDGTTIFKTTHLNQHTIQFNVTNNTSLARGIGLAVLLGCDYDQDGFFNHRDLDSDQDGLLDGIEAQCTNQGLTIDCAISNQPNYPDFNLDGCPDGIHQLACGSAPDDFDQDGVPNFLDLDSDNDGCGDALEVGFDLLVPVNIDTVIYPLAAGSIGAQGQVRDNSMPFCIPVPNQNWLDTTYRLACAICNLPDLTITGLSSFFVCPTIAGNNNFDLSTIPVIDNNPASNNALNLSYHNASPPDSSNLLASPIVQPTVTTTYYIMDTEDIYCSDYVPYTIFVDNSPPIATPLPSGMLNCGVPLPLPIGSAKDYVSENTFCRKNIALEINNSSVFNDFINPICEFTPGNSSKTVISDVFDSNGYINPDVDGSLDISFDVELISLRDIYGGDPMNSPSDATFNVQQTTLGITGSIPINTTANNILSAGDAKGYMVTVKFAQHLQIYAEYFNLDFEGMNTPGVFFESGALQVLDFYWNPFNGKEISVEDYSGYFHGTPNLPYGIDCTGSVQGMGFVDVNPWKIAGPGVKAFQDNGVVDTDTDQCNPTAGQLNPATNNPSVNAALDLGINPTTRIGGFRYLVLVENVAGAQSSSNPTSGSGIFTSSLKRIILNRVCQGNPFISDDNPFFAPAIFYLGDVSDNLIPETITRTYEVTDACGNSSTVQQQFVRERGSDLSATASLIPGNVVGVSPVDIAVRITELGGFDTDGTPITIRVPKDHRLTFTWNPTLTQVAFNTVQNAQWTYNSTNPIFHEFTHNGVIAGHHTLSFGMKATYDPQGTYGQTTFTCTVVPGSGGECLLTNNTDSEILIYFD